MPQIIVNWTSSNASLQFKLWRKEVERIIGGPLAARSDRVKLNHIYIWAGAHAESLIEARLNKNPELRINTPTTLLDQLATCLTHSNYFREKERNFTAFIRKVGKILQPIFPSDATIRVMSGADLQNCGTVCVNVTCNEITKKAKFYVTKHEYAFILGLELCKMCKLVTISPVCKLQSVSLEPNQVETVHILMNQKLIIISLKQSQRNIYLLGGEEVTLLTI